jgi:hypothetical protein
MKSEVKVVDKTPPRTVRADSLDYGDFCRYGDQIYMRARMVCSCRRALYLVQVRGGSQESFSPDAQVILLDADVHVREKD